MILPGFMLQIIYTTVFQVKLLINLTLNIRCRVVRVFFKSTKYLFVMWSDKQGWFIYQKFKIGQGVQRLWNFKDGNFTTHFFFITCTDDAVCKLFEKINEIRQIIAKIGWFSWSMNLHIHVGLYDVLYLKHVLNKNLLCFTID